MHVAADFLRIALALFIITIGMSYWILHFPNRMFVLVGSIGFSCLILLTRFGIPRFLLPNYVEWLPKVFLPIFGLILGALYFKSGLRAGLFLSVGMVVGSVFISIILSTNIVFSFKHKKTDLLMKFIPQIFALFVLVTFLVSTSIGMKKTGVVIIATTIIVVALTIILHYTKHYAYLFFTTFLFGVFPSLPMFPKLLWYYNALGLLMIIVWIFRRDNGQEKVDLNIRFIFVIGLLYFVWSIITFIYSPIQNSKTLFKIYGVIGQMLFIYGLFKNLKTKHDFRALLFGYLFGSFITMMSVIYGLLKMLAEFNIYAALAHGFRATAQEQSPNHVMVPVFITFVVLFSYVIKSKGIRNLAALILSTLCVVLIVLANSRQFMFLAILASIIISMQSAKWRRIVYYGIGVGATLFIIAFYANPALTALFTRLESLSTGSGRVVIWNKSWDMFLDHVILGRGPNAAQYILPVYMNKYWLDMGTWVHGKSHNVFLTEGIDNGLVGFIFIAMIYYFIFVWVRKAPKNPNQPWRIAAYVVFTSFIIRGFVESGDVLFVNSVICYGFTPVIILILGAGQYFYTDEHRSNDITKQVLTNT